MHYLPIYDYEGKNSEGKIYPPHNILGYQGC